MPVKKGSDGAGAVPTNTYVVLGLPALLRSVLSTNRLAGLVVKASASRAEDHGFESRLRWDFSGSSHTSDFKIGTPVATRPGVWH